MSRGNTRKRGRLVALVVPGMAVVVALSAVVVRNTSVVPSALEAASGIAVVAIASVAVHRAYGRSVEPGDVYRLLGWLLVGVLAIGAIGAWYRLAGVEPRGPSVSVGWFTALAIGIAVCTLVAAFDALARRRQRSKRAAVERHRETITVMNRLLRHHLLNGLNVVEGHADRLETHVDEDGRPDLRTVRSKSAQLAETVQRFERIATQLSEGVDPEPVALGARLEAELARVRTAHEGVTVAADDVPPDHRVLADETLPLVLRNVLSNAVQHNDSAAPRIEVTVDPGPERSRITVADNGPGIPDSRKAEIFDASVRGGDSDGDGLGLFLAESVVEGYGGEIRVEDSASGGAAFVLELPTA